MPNITLQHTLDQVEDIYEYWQAYNPDEAHTLTLATAIFHAGNNR